MDPKKVKRRAIPWTLSMVGTSFFPQYWAQSMETPEPSPIKMFIKILEYWVAKETAEMASCPTEFSISTSAELTAALNKF